MTKEEQLSKEFSEELRKVLIIPSKEFEEHAYKLWLEATEEEDDD